MIIYIQFSLTSLKIFTHLTSILSLNEFACLHFLFIVCFIALYFTLEILSFSQAEGLWLPYVEQVYQDFFSNFILF